MIEKEEGNDQNMSCCGNESESIIIAKKNNLCPVCEKQGTLVKNITVKNMVIDETLDAKLENRLQWFYDHAALFVRH